MENKYNNWTQGYRDGLETALIFMAAGQTARFPQMVVDFNDEMLRRGHEFNPRTMSHELLGSLSQILGLDEE